MAESTNLQQDCQWAREILEKIIDAYIEAKY